jgi:hypothetical protein
MANVAYLMAYDQCMGVQTANICISQQHLQYSIHEMNKSTVDLSPPYLSNGISGASSGLGPLRTIFALNIPPPPPTPPAESPSRPAGSPISLPDRTAACPW